MLRKYRLHKRAAALITALSLVMMLVVSYARIQPGVAFGGNTEVSAYKNNVRQLMASGSMPLRASSVGTSNVRVTPLRYVNGGT